MKKLVVAVFSVIAINILLFCPFSEAYSLDDIKRDYPTLEIKYIYNSDGTFGRSLKILGLSSGKNRECKIVCVKSNCADLFYAPYWGKQLKGWISNGKT